MEKSTGTEVDERTVKGATAQPVMALQLLPSGMAGWSQSAQQGCCMTMSAAVVISAIGLKPISSSARAIKAVTNLRAIT
jgi:hypothetical protein